MPLRDEDVEQVVKGFTPHPPPPAVLTIRFDGTGIRAMVAWKDGAVPNSIGAPVSDALRQALADTLAAAQADITERSTREQLTRYLAVEIPKLPRVEPVEEVRR